ncbi:MAG: YdjY domain-containing protein [Gemmataceae bacterium]|nr:YdjY domain-containing protein [Gemmataceae bacterium]
MSTTTYLRCVLAGFALLGLTALGCEEDGPAPAPKAGPDKQPAAKKTQLARNVFLETQGQERRVLINATVCRREDFLEQLLCRKLTKEHESILTADIDAKYVHAALLATRAQPGKPVQFLPDQPKPKPPTGAAIKVWLEYRGKDGKTVKVPAQSWVRHVKTKKNLEVDWVFAGSILIPDPDKKEPPAYAANDGNVICLANFDTAMLDLPINSTKEGDGLLWEAHTERIPPLDTPVTVILEPVRAKKK